MVSRIVQSACCSCLAPARWSWRLNIQEFCEPVIKPFAAWNCPRWEYLHHGNWQAHKSGLALFFLKGTVFQTLGSSVFPFFSTLPHETHLSSSSRWQSHCMQPMGSQGAGRGLPALALHLSPSVFPSRGAAHTGTLGAQIIAHQKRLFSPLYPLPLSFFSSIFFFKHRSLQKNSPASFHFIRVSHSALIRSSIVSLIRVRAGDKSVSEKRKNFFPFKI